MNPRPRLRSSFVFPYRWLSDPEDRKFFGENIIKNLNPGKLKEIYSTSANDPYFNDFAQPYVQVYYVRIKTHAYQPVKVDLTKAQMQTYLKDAFPGAKCGGVEMFFVQGSNQQPMMEFELYY